MAQRIEIRRLRGTAREAHAREVLTRFEASALSQSAFARREGVSPVTLKRWRRAFEAPTSGADPVGQFIEVEVPGPVAGAGAASDFHVALSDGRVVRVPRGFDAQELSRLLAVLERTPC